MRTSIATVCVSGTLTEKLHACAAAGFDGVEVFEPDLVAAPESPEEIRALAGRLGLSLDLYQPMRDVEGVDEAVFAEVLRRAEAKFALMRRLGIDTVLCCSNVGTATVDDDRVSAEQLRRLGDLAQRHGIRIAYEALAWGRYVDDYRRAWRIVQLADHAAVGICLDSFHVLSKGHDPAGIGEIPGEKIFFLQVADAPDLSLDVLSWSRHHRLFPGEGAFDLVDFVARVLRTGYAGPVSLEVFNDTFRQTDPVSTAVHARRSLRWLEDGIARTHSTPGAGSVVPPSVAALPTTAPPAGFDFVEVKAEDTSDIEAMLAQVGFTSRGRHRTKPVTLWTAGRARVVLNEQHAGGEQPHVAALGFAVADARRVTLRAAQLHTPRVHRRTYASEQALDGAVAPDGTEVYWSTPGEDGDSAWVREFEHGDPVRDTEIVAVDHVSLTLPWQTTDETVLFYTATFALRDESSTDVASPRGLVQSRVLASPDDAVRIPLNVAPPAFRAAALPRHVAFRCTDAVSLARHAREQGMELLRIPDNYYEDLAARTGLDAAMLEAFRGLGILYDRDGETEYLNFYTRTVGGVFFEFVERRGGYAGYGAGNAPIRLSAQSLSAQSRSARSGSARSG
jgi:4-hydroxyphenylpyruvate dioxygenase